MLSGHFGEPGLFKKKRRTQPSIKLTFKLKKLSNIPIKIKDEDQYSQNYSTKYFNRGKVYCKLE